MPKIVRYSFIRAPNYKSGVGGKVTLTPKRKV